MAKKQYTINEQIRQLFQLAEVIALREEVEQRARERAKVPRPVSLKSLSALKPLLTWPRLVQIADVARHKCAFLRDTGTRILPKHLMQLLIIGAGRVWSFR